MKKLLLIWVMAVAAWAQDEKTDEYVTVPKQYVSVEGLAKAKPEIIGQQWVGLGKEIGILTRDALSNTVDVAEKFGSTRVGYFVMIMVAWKVLGSDAKHIFISIPLCLLCIWIWSWSMRRFFFGINKPKRWYRNEYIVPRYDFGQYGGDAKSACAWVHIIAAGGLVLWLVLSAVA